MKKHVTAAICAGLMASTAIAADDDWGYGENNGPTKWGDLNPAYARMFTWGTAIPHRP